MPATVFLAQNNESQPLSIFFGKGCFYVLCYPKKYVIIPYMFSLGGNDSEYTKGYTTAFELVFGALPFSPMA